MTHCCVPWRSKHSFFKKCHRISKAQSLPSKGFARWVWQIVNPHLAVSTFKRLKQRLISYWELLQNTQANAMKISLLASLIVRFSFAPVILINRLSWFPDDSLLFEATRKNAEKANIGFIKSQRYLEAWLSHRDSASGLIPRNLETSNFWNARDAAADNYPFMVLTSFFVDSARFNHNARNAAD